jgi:hypothetical protein
MKFFFFFFFNIFAAVCKNQLASLKETAGALRLKLDEAMLVPYYIFFHITCIRQTKTWQWEDVRPVRLRWRHKNFKFLVSYWYFA